MIAKIGRGANLFGALLYNMQKVEAENGQVLYTQNMYETIDGHYTLGQLAGSFVPNLTANKRTEKSILHISLNPDPNDKVSDQQFRQMAHEYMAAMGYGDQPFVVFKHTDIERTHIHIVSTCVDKEGNKISDKFEKRRSMEICRKLEQQYGLIPATEKKQNDNSHVFQPVNYRSTALKSQIASVVRHLPKYYHFQSLGAYNALLSLFNITAEKVSGELHGKERNGLVYFALNEHGEKASNPFKSSLFVKPAGMAPLEKHFEKSKEAMQSGQTRAVLKNTVEIALHTTDNEIDFKKQLVEQGVNVVVRCNDDGRIYGVTFIDHESRTVWNGSQLDRKLSAKTFHDSWENIANTERPEINENQIEQTQQNNEKSLANNTDEVREDYIVFDTFSANDADNLNWFAQLGGLILKAQSDDYGEIPNDYHSKKKKKRNRSLL